MQWLHLLQKQSNNSYMPGYIVARKLAISGHLVSRITGTIFVMRGSKSLASNSKMNVGLNLKFNKKNLQVRVKFRRHSDQMSVWTPTSIVKKVFIIRAQWLKGRASDSRLREPGFESCAAVLKPWASLNEYLAIDSGGYVYEQPSCINCSIWLDASQRSQDGVE